MMNKDKIGLYIHVPFCVKKCNYCDFCSFDTLKSDERDLYVSALCRELIHESEKLNGRKVDTVFFGGGTPSLLNEKQFENIFSVIGKYYTRTDQAEISAEINPATASYDKLRLMRGLGINRLSIGMQSSIDSELSLLGRAHTASDFYTCFESARAVGFDNINVDLMYGIPAQTLSTFEKTLDSTLSLGCEHISAYALKIEEGTPFFKNKASLLLPDEESEYGMYMLCVEKMKDAGYFHYEISNYAKANFECRHNLKYWRSLEYIGVGVCAYSYFENERYGNISSIDDYISNSGVCQKTDVEYIGERERENEYIMLALRLGGGIDDVEFKKLFGVSFFDKYSSAVNLFKDSEYAEKKGTKFSLTDKGMYVSNSIICEFLEN